MQQAFSEIGIIAIDLFLNSREKQINLYTNFAKWTAYIVGFYFDTTWDFTLRQLTLFLRTETTLCSESDASSTGSTCSGRVLSESVKGW